MPACKEEVINRFSYRSVVSFLFLTVADFQKLQEAKEVLCDETKRKNYDLWRRSGVTIPFHEWQSLNDSVKTVCDRVFFSLHMSSNGLCQKPCNSEGRVICLQSMHWAVRNKKEPMLEAAAPDGPDSAAEGHRCEQIPPYAMPTLSKPTQQRTTIIKNIIKVVF